MMALYLLGIVMALLASFVLKLFIQIKEKSYFILELPVYRAPRWGNVGMTMIQKAKIFVVDAGKVIIMISLLLWFLSSYGPSEKMDQLNAQYTMAVKSNPAQEAQLEKQYNTDKLANSYAGILGKKIEPVIKPLGYDWKIGVALLSSFAAREVFVGSLATIYSVGDDNDNQRRLIEKLKYERNEQGKPVYSLATGLSLLIFYVFAMQCMATLAVVKRETNGWKWPIIQLIYMGTVAYLCAFITFQFLS